MLPVVAKGPGKDLNMEKDSYNHIEDQLTQDHIRLLYLVSLYSRPAESDDEEEQWVRSHVVYILVFEGIVSGVFNYDYSASSEIVGSQRVLMNVSQEGKDDLDDL